MSERHDPDPRSDFAALNGWDREFEVYSDFDLPTYVGPTTFMMLSTSLLSEEAVAERFKVASSAGCKS